MFFVYVLARTRRGPTYIGHTNNLARRQGEHASGRGARYPKRLGLRYLVYAECYATRSEAVQRERALKALYNGWHDALYALIERDNPRWLGLDAAYLVERLSEECGGFE